MMKRFILSVAFIGALMSSALHAQVEKNIPSEEEEKAIIGIQIPNGSGFELSPDGKLLAYFDTFKDVPNVFMRHSSGGKIRQVSFVGDSGVDQFYWLTNTHIAFVTAGVNNMLYEYDIAKDEFRRISSEGCNVRVLYASSNEGFICFEMNSVSRPYNYDYCRFYKSDSDAQVLERNETGMRHWAPNQSGDLAFNYRLEGARVLFSRDMSGVKFAHLDSCSQFRVLGPSNVNKGRHYCLSDAGRIGSALIEMDMTGSTKPREIFSKVGCSVERVLFAQRDRRPIMAWYRGKENGFALIDRNLSGLYETIKSAIPGKLDFQIISSSVDENVWLVATTANNGKLRYYRYNVANKELKAFNTVEDTVEEKKPKVVVYPVKDTRGKDMLVKYYTPDVLQLKYPTLLVFGDRPWALTTTAHDSLLYALSEAGFPILEVDFVHSESYGAAAYQNGYDWWAGMVVSDMPIYVAEINKMFASSPGIVPCGIGSGAQIAQRLMNIYPELKNRSVLINPVFDVNAYASFLKSTNDADARFYLKPGTASATDDAPLYNAGTTPMVVFSGADPTMAELLESSLSTMALSGNTPEIVSYSDETGICQSRANRDYVVSEIVRYANAVAVRKMK